MPEVTQETQPPPASEPNPLFQTPKVEAKPLEAPQTSNFMSDLTKSFKAAVPDPLQAPPEQQPPVAEPPKEPEPEPPAHFSKKAQEDWRKRDQTFKSEIKTREDRIHDLEAQLAKVNKSLPDLESELAKTRETLAERDKALERFDVERAPVYKDRVLEPEESVRSRLAKQELQPNEIAALLGGSITQREQALENPRFSSYRKGQIIQLLDKWDEVQETKTQMLANGKRSLEQYTREQAEAESAKKAQFIREAQAIYDDQCTQLMTKLEPYTEIPPDQDKEGRWNQGVAIRKAQARAIYNGAMDRTQLAQAAIWAPAAYAYRELLGMALKRIQELDTSVNKMRGVAPGVRDSGGDTQILATPRPASDGDFVKGLVERFNKEAIS